VGWVICATLRLRNLGFCVAEIGQNQLFGQNRLPTTRNEWFGTHEYVLANLAVANLAVANLIVANLANLAVTNLAVANLAVTNLAVTNLAVANLTVANLTIANLAKTIISNTPSNTTIDCFQASLLCNCPLLSFLAPTLTKTVYNMPLSSSSHPIAKASCSGPTRS
jgi:uncharacterized protein YjbI with pentapeptide repeats